MLLANSAFALPEGFVDVQTIDPSIIVDLRYIGNDNFIGRPIPGYKENRAILTFAAAQALKKAQEMAKKDGYSLVIYDAYRPQRASGAFKVWSRDPSDTKMQAWFYPRIDKEMLFELDYIAEFSSHNRGSTVDITLIPLTQKPHAIQPTRRTLLDGYEFWFLDDGTVDMGSSFDLFDSASHYENDLITQPHKQQRAYLRAIMEQAGFEHYPEEWWHFTLKNEPFPETYFDF
jgi:D-alanyl-D-alanine dipeptidase